MTGYRLIDSVSSCTSQNRMSISRYIDTAQQLVLARLLQLVGLRVQLR
jgi:hypothetical protein